MMLIFGEIPFLFLGHNEPEVFHVYFKKASVKPKPYTTSCVNRKSFSYDSSINCISKCVIEEYRKLPGLDSGPGFIKLTTEKVI